MEAYLHDCGLSRAGRYWPLHIAHGRGLQCPPNAEPARPGAMTDFLPNAGRRQIESVLSTTIVNRFT
jgi:hypothetical protein